MIALKLILFSLGWIGGVYLFNSLLARQFKPIDLKRALVYISSVAMLGLFGEIFVDSMYNHIFGSPLWRYNFLPIHHAYTSTFAIVLWGAYGFHLYLLHDNLRKWSVHKELQLAGIFAVEALIIEALVELTSRFTLGDYLYYYYPNGLWHISAFQNFPFYFICGLLIVKTVKRFVAEPRFFIFLNSWLILMVVVFL